MQAIVFEKIGGPLVLTEVADPVASSGEVLIEIYAASVNPADYKVRQGFYAGVNELQMPHISGRDFSGVVKEVGDNVDEFSVNDEVFGVLDVGHEGTYAELVSEKASLVAKKPSSLSHAEACALSLTGLTALVSLDETGRLTPGEKILIQGGAGGVGSYAVQYASHIGAEVIATSSEHNHNYLTKLGANQLIDYNRIDFRDLISDCDLVFDTVGYEVHKNSYAVLKTGGRLIYIAPQPENFEAPRDDVKVLRPKVGRSRAYLERIIELAEQKAVIAPAIQTFPLSKASLAQEKIKTGHVRGKVVLEIRG